MNNFTLNVSDLTDFNFDKLPKEITTQDIIQGTSNNLNDRSILFFIVYCSILFGVQYLLEKKLISVELYIKINKYINDIFTAIAIIFLVNWVILKFAFENSSIISLIIDISYYLGIGAIIYFLIRIYGKKILHIFKL